MIIMKLPNDHTNNNNSINDFGLKYQVQYMLFCTTACISLVQHPDPAKSKY